MNTVRIYKRRCDNLTRWKCECEIFSAIFTSTGRSRAQFRYLRRLCGSLPFRCIRFIEFYNTLMAVSKLRCNIGDVQERTVRTFMGIVELKLEPATVNIGTRF